MILVTGASGLVGVELIHQLLREGKTVKALIHHTDLPVSHPQLIKVKGNVLDVVSLEEAMLDVQQVYHCAALIAFDPKQRAHMFKLNVEGTANVVNAALTAGVKKLVHISSVAALERMQEDGLVDESTHWTPGKGSSKYGQTKYLSELEIFRGIEEGLPAAMVNPSIIIGPGDLNNFSTKIFKTVYKGFPWYTEGATGFVDVRDVARSMILLMNSDISGEKFIISASNENFRHAFSMIANNLKKRRPFIKASTLITEIYWRLEKVRSMITGNEPLLTKETVKAARAKVNFDNSKFLKAFPSFSYISVEQSIEETCKALLPHLQQLK